MYYICLLYRQTSIIHLKASMSNSVLLVDRQDVLIKESGLNGLYIGEGVKGVWLKDKDKGVNDPLTKVSSELLIILCWVFLFVSVNAYLDIFVSKWITYSCIHELTNGENAINSHLKHT